MCLSALYLACEDGLSITPEGVLGPGRVLLPFEEVLPAATPSMDD